MAAIGLGGEARPKTPPARPPAQNESLRVPITVNGGEGTLDGTHLEARVNGQRATVSGLRSPGDDLVLITVWDVAGDLSLVDLAKSAFVEKVRSLRPNVYTAVLRANENMQVILDPTGDRDAIASAVGNVPVVGKAAFLDTVVTASQLADAIAKKSGVRTAVLFITDSDVANYREDFTNPVINSSDSRDLSRRFPEGLVREKISKVSDSLGAVQAPIFFVHLAHRPDRLNDAYRTGLLQLANSTGGTGLFCRSSTEIGDSVRKAVDGAMEQYVALVQVPPRTPKNIAVELASTEHSLSYRTRFVLHK